MKKAIANLKAIVEVMDALSKDADPNGVGRLIIEEVHHFCPPTSECTFQEAVNHITIVKIYLGFTTYSFIITTNCMGLSYSF